MPYDIIIHRKNNTNKYKNDLQKLLREVGMAVPKGKGTRVGWLITNVLEHPCYIVFGYQNATIKKV